MCHLARECPVLQLGPLVSELNKMTRLSLRFALLVMINSTYYDNIKMAISAGFGVENNSEENSAISEGY